MSLCGAEDICARTGQEHHVMVSFQNWCVSSQISAVYNLPSVRHDYNFCHTFLCGQCLSSTEAVAEHVYLVTKTTQLENEFLLSYASRSLISSAHSRDAYSAPSSSGFVVAFNFGLVAVAAIFTLF
ncbi:hypothetical protein PROFUN_11791 [Planoprotostelium fungivorum]|uniref:Uncharacterized protein n=1 Tax=Planoprotostelium fungivorum TaxID=1890364 RepID=A0A2P6N8N5_9EUKA|nr:hypothetical protein PROFUN_11791 [Planoprotostelium fungivorum]